MTLQDISMVWAFRHKPMIQVYGGTLYTLKSGVTTRPGRIMVAEECIVNREGEVERLTDFAGSHLPVV